MSIWNDVIAACVAINLCPAPEISELPDDDGTSLEYKKEERKPEPIVKEEIPVLPPLVIEKTVYLEESAPEAVIEPPVKEYSKPKVNPKIVAYYDLLNLRRSSPLNKGLNSDKFTVNTASSLIINEDNNDLSTLDNIPLFEPSLDFNLDQKKEYPQRYMHSSSDSGYPVDNSRIMRNDRYINARFEGGVNSQLATGGEVVLQVTDHVFGYHGRNILIPKGSRLVCTFEVPALANSTRLSFECYRLLIADTAVEIYELKSAVYDVQGNIGISGLVDRRFWDRYGEALIISGVSTAMRIAAGSIKTSADNPNLTSSINSGAEELSQRFGEITASILENQINTKPIIRISQGTSVVIKPANDWYIAKPL